LLGSAACTAVIMISSRNSRAHARRRVAHSLVNRRSRVRRVSLATVLSRGVAPCELSGRPGMEGASRAIGLWITHRMHGWHRVTPGQGL
jgi:hypothetical protein